MFGQLAVEALCLYSSIIVETTVLVVIISYVTLELAPNQHVFYL